ncbi:MAG: DNA topoisomerase VI subunit B [Candidatus Diapherotrites archaeon]
MQEKVKTQQASQQKSQESNPGIQLKPLVTAEELAKDFKEHSVAEFFKKNRQMLGLFGKVRTLTTIIHEYSTNSVTWDTPSVVRVNGTAKIERIGEIIDELMEKKGFEFNEKQEIDSLRDLKEIEVLCFDKKTNKLKFKEVKSVHRHRMKDLEKIFKIKTVGNRCVETTKHHSLFTLENGRTKSIKADELNVGDYIIVPRNKWIEETKREINLLEECMKIEDERLKEFSIFGVKDILYSNEQIKNKIKSQLNPTERHLDFYRNYMKCDRLPVRLLKILSQEERKLFYDCRLGARHCKYKIGIELEVNSGLMQFLGFFIAEGSTRKTLKSSSLSFGAHKKEIIEYNSGIIKELFGFKPVIRKAHETAVNIELPSTIAFILINIFGCGLGARQKRIPGIVFNASEDLAREFLFAYLSGDGYPSQKLFNCLKEKRFELNQKITLATASSELIVDLQYLLSALSYSYSYQSKKASERTVKSIATHFNESHIIEFYLKQKNSPLNFYPLSIGGITAVIEPKLKWAINKRGQQIASYEKLVSLKINEAQASEETALFLGGDLGVLQVTEISQREPKENEYVYDYSVGGDENFVGGFGAICLHNSLDACESSGILPDIEIKIQELGEEFYEVTAKDNGPGLTKDTVGKALGQLLAGTKFHRRVQSRGQQGIGACMKGDTLVPFSDGRIIPIKEIVEKEIPGECISLDSKTLKLVPAKISKFWKIKNPYFIKINTLKGRQILLTPENPVLTINDGKLEWIRADEIIKGTKIAAPNKLFAFTNSTKMLEIFDDLTIQVDEPELVQEIKERLLKKYKSLNKISKKFGIKKDRLRNWFNRKMNNRNPRGRPTLKLIKILGEDVGFIEEELINRIANIGRNGTYSKIPLFLDEETAWIAGLIAGDGHLNSGKDDEWGVNITFTNKNKELINKYKEIIEKKFGLKTQTYFHEKKKYYTVQCSPKILSEIFEFFGVKRGKKSDCFVLSNNLMSQKEEIISAYVKGLFDAEGSVSIKKRTVSLILYNPLTLEQLFYALLRLGIHANINKCREQKRLTITEKSNLYKFLQKVGFSEDKKTEQLIKILNSKKTNTFTDTIPNINPLIRELFAKNNLPLTALPTASYSAVHNKNISRNSLQQVIQVIGEKNELIYNLANADVCWLEVKDISIEKNNEEFVYDLEIERHHNFIAGGVVCHNSGVTMFSQTTTGKPVRVITGTGKGKAISLELTIDPKKNEPKIMSLQEIDKPFRGVAIQAKFKDVLYRVSEQGPLEYLRRTAIANPHAEITFIDPEGAKTTFKRTIKEIPKPAQPVLPHPKGVTVDELITMAKYAESRKVSSFLKNEFDRMGDKAIEEIIKKVSFDMNKDPKKLEWAEAEEIIKCFKEIDFIAPSADSLRPIGEEQVTVSLKSIVKPEFLSVITRKPQVYRGGFPFQVEVAVAYGGEAGRQNENNKEEGKEESTGRKIEVMRFANRAPLLFDGGGCAITKAVQTIDWRRYGIQDVDNAPLTVFVNLISVYVPYTSAGKQAIADEEEVLEELRLALMDAGRKIVRYIVGKRKEKEKQEKKRMYMKYAIEVAYAVSALTGKEKKSIEKKLLDIVLKKLKLEEQEEKRIEEESDEELEKEIEKELKKQKKEGKGKKKKGSIREGEGEE